MEARAFGKSIDEDGSWQTEEFIPSGPLTEAEAKELVGLLDQKLEEKYGPKLYEDTLPPREKPEGWWAECVCQHLHAVQAENPIDYLERYYKAERLHGQGDWMRGGLRAAYIFEFDEQGFCCSSHHDNITGQFIFFYGPPAATAK